jgi:transcriptional regulator with XRE-family HTH domain
VDSLLLQSPSQLSLHLKSLRKSRKLSQADMAKRLQVTQERYSKMERNPQLIASGDCSKFSPISEWMYY